MMKNLNRIILIVFFLLALFYLESSAETKVNLINNSSKEILDNGLTVLITEMPSSSMVAVYVLIKTGSATEDNYLGYGMSHCLEHMLFKGTQKRKMGEIASTIQSIGGSINASTSFDYTIFTVYVPSEKFDIALDVLSDAIINSSIDENELKKEKDVIMNEMRMNNDDPDYKLSRMTFESVFLNHTYRHPIIGYKDLFAKIERENVLEYYKRFYVPNNMIVSIAGNINKEEALSKVKEAFNSLHIGNVIVRNLPKESEQITPRRSEKEITTDLTRLSMAYRSVSLLDKDLFALDILARALGQGNSSRLSLNIKNKRLVYSISAVNYTPMDYGLFEVDCLLDYDKVEKVILECINQIEIIKNKGLKEEELNKAKRQTLTEYIFGKQTASNLAYSQASDEAFAGDYKFAEKYVEGVGRVINEDIINVAKKYLRQESLNINIVKPNGAVNLKRVSEEKKKVNDGIKKYTLANGFTVLLKESHELPIISTSLVFQGGLRYEPKGLNGISNIFSKILLKGTQTKTANKIAELTESLGISLGNFSGSNSFGITSEFLVEDEDTVLNLLEEIIKKPAFPEEELLKIKEITKAYIKSKKDDIFQFTSMKLKEELFSSHPYKFPQEGTVESVEKITKKDIVDFYKKLVNPSNMVLSIFGDINSDLVLEKIKKAFGSLTKSDMALMKFDVEKINSKKEEVLTMDKEQAILMMGFLGTTIKSEDRFCLEVLISILGSSFDGRLFKRIREEFGDAYSLSANSIPGIETGYVYLYILTNNENIESVQKIVNEEIIRIQKDGITEEELNKVKTYLKGNFKADLETNSALGFKTSLDEIYGLGYNEYEEYNKKIDTVTTDNIRELANLYLDLNKCVIIITKSKI